MTGERIGSHALELSIPNLQEVLPETEIDQIGEYIRKRDRILTQIGAIRQVRDEQEGLDHQKSQLVAQGGGAYHNNIGLDDLIARNDQIHRLEEEVNALDKDGDMKNKTRQAGVRVVQRIVMDNKGIFTVQVEKRYGEAVVLNPQIKCGLGKCQTSFDLGKGKLYYFTEFDPKVNWPMKYNFDNDKPQEVSFNGLYDFQNCSLKDFVPCISPVVVGHREDMDRFFNMSVVVIKGVLSLNE